MLDDFGHELGQTDSKLDSTMKKMAKLMHVTNGEELNLFVEKIKLNFIYFQTNANGWRLVFCHFVS